jgi:hypothetical protein
MRHHGSRTAGRNTQVLSAEWFVGIDWAEDAHDVCILDRGGRVSERTQVKHTAVAFRAFIDALVQRTQGQPLRLAIGIEAPRGALVELCVERGSACTPSTRNKSIGFAIDSRWVAPKMTHATRM